MKNYWLDRSSQEFRKTTRRFLDEAIEWSKNVAVQEAFKYFNITPIMLESCRLKNEFYNDEEYAAYLKDFNERHANLGQQ